MTTACDRLKRSVCGLVFLATAACSGDQPAPVPAAPGPAAPEPATQDSAAITHVIDPAAFDSLTQTELQPFLRLGTVDGAEDYAFDRVLGMERDAFGRLYVLERRGISVFEPDGRFLARFGEPGPGPAELSNPRSIAISGDTVFVLDSEMKLLRTSGEFLHQVRPPDTASMVTEFMASDRIWHTTDGVAVRRVLVPDWLQRDLKAHEFTQRLRFLDVSTGRMSTAVHSVTSREHWMFNRSRLGPSVGGTRANILAAPDGRVFISDSTFFEILVLDRNGAAAERITSPVPRIPVSRRDVDDQLREHESRATPDRRGMIRREFRNVPRAEYRPAIDRILVSPRNDILVRRPDLTPRPLARSLPGALSVWHLLGPDRRPAAAYRLPLRFREYGFDGCVLIGTITDEDDVPTIVMYHLRPENVCAS